MSNIIGIDHIDIVVEDPITTARFLEMMGFEILRHMEGARGSVEVRIPGGSGQPILELSPACDAAGKVRPLGLRHIAYSSPDLEATIADFAAVGLLPKCPPRRVADTGRRVVNFIDPEGGTVQLVDRGAD